MRSSKEVIEIFNTRYNNINSGVSPGINIYEISLYLTQAQREIIEEYYKGTPNNGESFEKIERVRKNITKIITQKEYNITSSLNPCSNKFYCYTINYGAEVWRVLWEKVIITSDDKCLNNKELKVVPVRHDDLYSVLDNPYKRPSNKKALRLDINNTHEIVSEFQVSKYYCRVLEHPKPFIVGDLEEFSTEVGLSDILTVEGMSTESLCVFDNFVEDIIIKRAVELASVDYKEPALQMQMQMNQRAE